MHQGHVLVVEDNPLNREVARSMLELLGFRMSLAETGQDTIAMAMGTPVDLILMDCHMPEMDGFAATEAIRRHEQHPGRQALVPITALTASAMDGNRQRCLAVGVDDYLSKPFSLEQLASTIARHICGKPAGQAPGRQPDTDKTV